jgi:uncharacterized protein with von Willebrand factor type A (vWA) domain
LSTWTWEGSRIFYNAARATLISNRDDLERFAVVFEEYWQGLRLPRGPEQTRHAHSEPEVDETGAGDKGPAQKLPLHNEGKGSKPGTDSFYAQTGASDRQALAHRDLAQLESAEREAVRQLIEQLAQTLLVKNYFRTRPAATGKSLDRRRLLRDTVRRDGHFYQLRYRKQKKKNARLFLLCDVSGSMDEYAGFLVQFFHAIQREIRGLEVAVFSTRLSVITPHIRNPDLREALATIGTQVHDWSGGTRIGACLEQFNRHYADELSRSRSIVMVLSDGWDRGDADLMREQMQNLRRRAHKLVWLNPLLAGTGYQPLARGMRTALPYLDEFLAFNNVESLKNVARVLRAD